MTPTLLLGHRGDPEHHPENTLPGFASAVACGAAGVELDVHLSRDGVAVVLHDDTLDRTTAGSGRVDAHTWPELDALGIPRLDAVLDALRGRVVAVELKPPHRTQPQLAGHVLDLAHRAGAGDTTWLLAFDHAHLAAARAHRGDAYTAALVRERPADPVATVSACGADALACWWENVDAALCDALRRGGHDLLAWTVDAEGEARRLAALGLRAVISNRPCALAPALAAAT